MQRLDPQQIRRVNNQFETLLNSTRKLLIDSEVQFEDTYDGILKALAHIIVLDTNGKYFNAVTAGNDNLVYHLDFIDSPIPAKPMTSQLARALKMRCLRVVGRDLIIDEKLLAEAEALLDD